MNENPNSHLDKEAYRIAYLIAGYIRKTLTEGEHNELDEWVRASDHNMQLFEELTDERNLEANLAWMDQVQTKKSFAALQKAGAFEKPFKRTGFNPVWIAAASVIVIAGIFFVYQFANRRNSGNNNSITVIDTTQIAPGGNRATLTLANGSVINLEGKNTGIIRKEEGTKIEKTAEGQLMYEKLAENKQVAFNTLSIPRGGQYALTLSDGTRVWLNALSSLKFPEQFSDSERVVELDGEAYFDVTKDKQHPFIVRMTDNEQVKVLGTQFNVNSYKDEESKKITLIEGNVEVTLRQAQGDKIARIKPGEQAIVKPNSLLTIAHSADVDEVIAWKNGKFVFKDADIYSIMRQAERWYDVNVIYKTTTSEHFNLTVPRNEPLSKILHLMELTGKIHFKTENKTVYVLP